jgi:hypothetical protein
MAVDLELVYLNRIRCRTNELLNFKPAAPSMLWTIHFSPCPCHLPMKRSTSEERQMLIRPVIVVAVALNIIATPDARASCRRVQVPEIIGVAVFKHYRADGGEVVDVVINKDVVRHYRTVGGKAKVRKLQVGKVRQAGWVPRGILLRRPVSCVAYRGPSQTPGTPFPLLDLLPPLQLLNPNQM